MLEEAVRQVRAWGDAGLDLGVAINLSALGMHIAIDDFGTGYSSLAYLKRLPVDEIKINRRFVTGMTRDRDDAMIVASTIGLGHSLGLRFVAEGVEDTRTLRRGAGLLRQPRLARRRTGAVAA